MASRCAVSCVLVAVGAAGLWNALHAQPVAPVAAGRDGVPVPVPVRTMVPPSGWLFDAIQLRVIVGGDGRVQDVTVTSRVAATPAERPAAATELRTATSLVHLVPGLEPSNTSATVAAVRQWEFAPTLIDGRATAVAVDVDVRFERRPESWFFSERADASSDVTVPPDFAFIYREGECELDTRSSVLRAPAPARNGAPRSLTISLTGDEMRSVHAEMLRVGFFSYPEEVGFQGSALRPAEIRFDRGETQLRATVLVDVHAEVVSSVPGFGLAARRGDEWTRVAWYGDVILNSGPARTPAIEGVRRLTRLVRDLLQSHAPGVVCGGFGI